MKKWLVWVGFFLCCFITFVPAGRCEARGQLRQDYRSTAIFQEETPYARLPRTEAPHEAGELSEAALSDALLYLNFIRDLAGLEPVQRSEIYDYQCQHGAVLLAALDYADHFAPCPADMEEQFYASAHLATTSSNIAKFNWMRPSILREGIAYFVRDDGEANLPVLGHRRWVLNPYMNATGFGLANSASGMSYVVMYAHDFGNEDAQWTQVCWPSAGLFPVELMHADLPWSITFNPQVYDMERSRIRVTLREETLGLEYGFDCASGTGSGACTLNADNYGAGPCAIFRPDFSETEFTDYQQNQRWTVEVTGLYTLGGREAPLRYAVEMTSLYPQEVANIELSQVELTLKAGEAAELSARVIPEYADDLTVHWTSSAPDVASVDERGSITAHRAGQCEITAASPNGRFDTCVLTVEK